MSKLPLEQRDDLSPVCPYCEQLLERIYYRQVREMPGKRNVYFCPSCLKVLGVSQERSPWTGH